MRIHMDQIGEDGLKINTTSPAEAFPALLEAAREEGLSFPAPIGMDLLVQRISSFVEVSGQLSATVRIPCARCLAPYDHALSVDFTATYTDVPPADEETDEEVELSPDLMDLFYFRGTELDIHEAVQEQILLSLPLQPLCREDCKGLCPRCGTDLNLGSCQCAGKTENSSFAALKHLKLVK